MPTMRTSDAETVRRLALPLPCTIEREHFGGPSFSVNGRMFALYWTKEQRWIIKLPHAQQMMLFDARPETFAPMRSGRMVWSTVELAHLGNVELADLLTSAWRTVAPKRLAGLLPGRAREKEMHP